MDVQVIAKIQEANLRQSVLNINKLTDSVNERNGGGYSTATITKRVHTPKQSMALQLPSQSYDYESAMRRDSASSSDHSSLSSTASTYESPYTSQVNVNGESLNFIFC